ncbi:general transcription factor II-I repeat domain-containing protein 2-like [Aphis craccivora]|uniref:General transcription factor II-I repeat domain-containing protein 2-like n=1 Tax=Aphis craccivora TaxID=307492 RepID=A0A6G0YIE4_APHCR|nr:general transcription factor II-I repeat domain-containing protein 2-like [Aphis craccivora]
MILLEQSVSLLEVYSKHISKANMFQVYLKNPIHLKTNVVQASYKVANLIVMRDFVEKNISVVEEIIFEKLELFKEISLSRNIITIIIWHTAHRMCWVFYKVRMIEHQYLITPLSSSSSAQSRIEYI